MAQAEILKFCGFGKGTFPMRYLGVPLSPKKLSKLEYNNVMEKITERVNCWAVRHLSYVGRLVPFSRCSK